MIRLFQKVASVTKKILPSNVDTAFCKVSSLSDDWIYGIITHISLKKNIAHIFIPSDHLAEGFNEGSSVSIKSVRSDSSILFTGTILRKSLSPLEQYIIIKIDEIRKFSNYRKHERFDASNPVTVRAKNGASVSGVLEDISLGGSLMLSKASLPENEQVDIDIHYNDTTTISFTGIILRKFSTGENYKYALKVESIDAQNNDLLCTLIEFLNTQKKDVARQWKTHKRVRYEMSMHMHRRKL